MHHIKDIIITLVPGLGGLYTALEASNLILKVLAGIGTLVWLGIRIAIAIKEYNKK